MAFAPNRILVATDFSPSAQAAADAAAALALKQGGSLTLLHITPIPTLTEYLAEPLPAQEIFQFEHAIRRTVAKNGETERARVAAQGVPVEFKSADGPAAMQIVAAAERGHHDLIVIGCHGRTGLSRVLLGSVAEAVVRHATVPVLTVRAPGEARGLG